MTSEETVAPAKSELRAALLGRRRSMSSSDRRAAGEAIARAVLQAPELEDCRVVAGYAGVGTEPPTLPILGALADRGVRVLLPVLLPDGDLDWAELSPDQPLAGTARGLLEPPGPRLGVETVQTADVVLCPGLAAGRDGVRLGRGGGSYDRVLARLEAARPWVCVLLYEHELVDAVPADPHDQWVAAAATPAGITRFARETR